MFNLKKIFSFTEDNVQELNFTKDEEVKFLYDHVDDLLVKFMISKNNVTPQIKIDGVLNALRNLFKKGFFDICVVKDCAELLKLKIPETRLLLYRTQHCIHWKDMEPQFRDALIAMILDDFRGALNLSEDKNICIEII